MPRYFFHLRDGTDIALDDEGRVFETEEALGVAMLRDSRDIMKADTAAGRLDLRLRIDAETADGTLVRRLLFVDALEIVYPDDHPASA